jgi:hypothetical protein
MWSLGLGSGDKWPYKTEMIAIYRAERGFWRVGTGKGDFVWPIIASCVGLYYSLWRHRLVRQNPPILICGADPHSACVTTVEGGQNISPSPNWPVSECENCPVFSSYESYFAKQRE